MRTSEFQGKLTPPAFTTHFHTQLKHHSNRTSKQSYAGYLRLSGLQASKKIYVSKQEFIIKRECVLILLTLGKWFSLSGYPKEKGHANKSIFSPSVSGATFPKCFGLSESKLCTKFSPSRWAPNTHCTLLQHCFNQGKKQGGYRRGQPKPQSLCHLPTTRETGASTPDRVRNWREDDGEQPRTSLEKAKQERTAFPGLKTRKRTVSPPSCAYTAPPPSSFRFKGRPRTSCAGTRQGGDSGPSLPEGGRKESLGRGFSGRFREKGARPLYGRRDTRHQMALPHQEPEPERLGRREEASPDPTLASVTGSARRRQPLLPDIKTSAGSRLRAGLEPEPNGDRRASGRKPWAEPAGSGFWWARLAWTGARGGGALPCACAVWGRRRRWRLCLSPCLHVGWAGKVEIVA